jgi:hypothetical protein
MRATGVILALGVWASLLLTAASPVAGVSPGPPTGHDRFTGEMNYETPSAGKFLNLRLTLNWQLPADTLSGRFTCQPRRGLGMATGDCPFSHGSLGGTFAKQVGEAGVTPSFYRLSFRVAGNDAACDFSAFAPYLQFGSGARLFYTLDGAYQCSDTAGTMTQMGKFSAFVHLSASPCSQSSSGGSPVFCP